MSQSPTTRSNPVARVAFATAGWISAGLGLIGVVLPLVPTTPFVLLAAACFARSSPRFHRWLREHRWLGPSLRAWEAHRAVPARAKRLGLVALWISFPIAILLAPIVEVQMALVALLVVATTLLARLPTLDDVDATTPTPRPYR